MEGRGGVNPALLVGHAHLGHGGDLVRVDAGHEDMPFDLG